MTETRAKTTSIEAQFASRIDMIRARFVLKLADRIQQTDAALSQMADGESHAVDAVATAYRWFHDVSGIGPNLGFEATGLEARSCADILVNPFLTRRGLSPDELASLTDGLESVRIAALRETRPIESNQRSAP
jgi:hypothetical protein